MDIGIEEPAITVEPVEDPYRKEEAPQEAPQPVQVPEREKVPA